LVLLGFIIGSFYSEMMKARTLSVVKLFPVFLKSFERFANETEDGSGGSEIAFAIWKWNRAGRLMIEKRSKDSGNGFILPPDMIRTNVFSESSDFYISELIRSEAYPEPYFYFGYRSGEDTTIISLNGRDLAYSLMKLLPEDSQWFLKDTNGNGFYFDSVTVEAVDFYDEKEYRAVSPYLIKYADSYYFCHDETLSSLSLFRLLPVYRTVPLVFSVSLVPFFVGFLLFIAANRSLYRLNRQEMKTLDTIGTEIKNGKIVTVSNSSNTTRDRFNQLCSQINEILTLNRTYEKEIERLTQKSSRLSENIRDNYKNVTSVNRLLQKFAFSEDYTMQRAIEAVSQVLMDNDQTISDCVVLLGKETVYRKGDDTISEENADKLTIEQGDVRINTFLKASGESTERDFLIKQEVLMTFLYTTMILFLLKHETQMDPFTGLYRFEHFSRLVQVELEKSKRYGYGGSLVLTNIKNYRLINERFGLNTSNHFIVTIARIIKQNIRQTDIAGRFSGDRFLVFFHETSKDECAKKMEGLKSLVYKTLPFEEQFNLWDFEYGITECCKGSKNITELITEASNALTDKRNKNDSDNQSNNT
jgi:diguanylate cyclase (GGDEF)-like protein